MKHMLSTAALWFALTLPTAIASTPPLAQRGRLGGGHGLDLAAMDRRVKPCVDFFRYANGGWLAHAKISPEHSEAGVDREVSDRDEAILHRVAERAATDKTAAPDSPAGKVGSFYRSGMDAARINADGIQPLRPELARIDAITDVPSLLAELGHLHRFQVDAAFSVGVEQDPKASDRQIAAVSQGGLGLPERGYYERMDKETLRVRNAYQAHIGKMLALLAEPSGQTAAWVSSAARDSQTVLALETKLAHASKYPADLRDPQANYHKMTLAQFETLTPGVDWQPYFDAVGLPNPGGFDVGQPQFFSALGSLLTGVPLSDWKTYLRWQLVSAEAPRLSDPLAAEDFHFYETLLHGVPQQRPRWKRVLAATDTALGDDLGRLFVAQAFSPQAKARTRSLVLNLKAALADDIRSLSWMSPATKKQALAKLAAMRVKVGYPDKWRDYSKLDVSSPSYVVNGMRADQFEFQRQLNKIGKPVDRGEWQMTASTNNAYYDDSMNDINFPAGILQPPYFDPQADDAVNYGEIGATIGHEMTHGFDDSGRQFDAGGNLRDWWTASDAKNFNSRAKGIIAQYAAYMPLPGLHINGSLTQGENIADIGGLKIAYLALEKTLRGKRRVKIDGFTPEQRFFLAYAQSWRSLDRPEGIRVQLLSDPHSPPKYRVLGPLADTPEFRRAFGCPPDPKAGPTAIW